MAVLEPVWWDAAGRDACIRGCAASLAVVSSEWIVDRIYIRPQLGNPRCPDSHVHQIMLHRVHTLGALCASQFGNLCAVLLLTYPPTETTCFSPCSQKVTFISHHSAHGCFDLSIYPVWPWVAERLGARCRWSVLRLLKNCSCQPRCNNCTIIRLPLHMY